MKIAYYALAILGFPTFLYIDMSVLRILTLLSITNIRVCVAILKAVGSCCCFDVVR